MEQSQMDNPEKLATQGTQEEEKQNKNTTQYNMCWTSLYINNLNRTSAIQQTIEDKNEPNIGFMRKSQRTSQHGIQNVTSHNRTAKKTSRSISSIKIKPKPKTHHTAGTVPKYN